MSETQKAEEARRRLVEIGGRTSQDLGLGRILGQILVHLYLSDGERSLDEIEDALGLSKAAVSVAVRQLESLGLLRQVWKKSDRKKYYRTADNIGVALQQGLLAFLTQRVQIAASELDRTCEELESAAKRERRNEDLRFVLERVKRAKSLQSRLSGFLNSPLLRIFVKP